MQRLRKQQGKKLTDKIPVSDISILARVREFRQRQVQTWDSHTSGNFSIHHSLFTASHQPQLTNDLQIFSLRNHRKSNNAKDYFWVANKAAGWLIPIHRLGSQLCRKLIIPGDPEVSGGKFHGHKNLPWAFALINCSRCSQEKVPYSTSQGAWQGKSKGPLDML